MKILHCPLNGDRNISEFIYGGEFKCMPDQNSCSDTEWADYVFNSDNRAGMVTEWWMHSASSYWFIVERHTVSDEIIATYEPQHYFALHQLCPDDFLGQAVAANSLVGEG